MLRYLNNKRAQSTAEYVIVLGLIIAAIVAMQTYVKRGLQGRIKDTVDFVDNAGQSTGVVQFTGSQYEPYYLSSDFASQRTSTEAEELLREGAVNRTSNEISARTGSQVLTAPQLQ
jgi:hypothetical protein